MLSDVKGRNTRRGRGLERRDGAGVEVYAGIIFDSLWTSDRLLEGRKSEWAAIKRVLNSL